MANNVVSEFLDQYLVPFYDDSTVPETQPPQTDPSKQTSPKPVAVVNPMPPPMVQPTAPIQPVEAVEPVHQRKQPYPRRFEGRVCWGSVVVYQPVFFALGVLLADSHSHPIAAGTLHRCNPAKLPPVRPFSRIAGMPTDAARLHRHYNVSARSIDSHAHRNWTSARRHRRRWTRRHRPTTPPNRYARSAIATILRIEFLAEPWEGPPRHWAHE